MSAPVQLNQLLKIAVNEEASDLHFAVGNVPQLRRSGRLRPIEGLDRLLPDDVASLARQAAGDHHWNILEKAGEVDFSYGLRGVGRFRCNVYRQRDVLSMALRVIPTTILPFEQLGLPSVLTELTDRHDGLVLVTGPTGSGKTTTLATMIDRINRTRQGVIITLEDPIEYLHSHQRSIVAQREIGSDTTSFAKALRACLRQDPDVVLVGEMRDLETISTAITAAETGHLVFSTLHTRGAAKTIDRIIDVFPAEQQQQIRIQLAAVLEAVVSQQLIPKIGGGMVPAVEVLLGTPAVRNMIREGKTHQIQSMIETGARYGMQTLDSALDRLVQRGAIEPEEAERRR